MQNTPSIYSFDCPVKYLNDYFQYLKKEDPDFSLRKWAKQMELKSHLVLQKILNSKIVLRKKHLEFLKRGITFDGNDELYFLALLDFVNANTAVEKKLYKMTLSHLSPGPNFNPKICKEANIFADWINMAILSLCKINKYLWQPERVFSVLHEYHQSIKLDEVERAIDVLVARDLLVRDENGFVKSKYSRVTTQTGITIETVHSYYDSVSVLAQKAAYLPYSEEKEFQCFSTPLRREDLPTVQALMRELRSNISKLAGEGKDADEVYQINLQLFPLTKLTGEKEAYIEGRNTQSSLSEMTSQV